MNRLHGRPRQVVAPDARWAQHNAASKDHDEWETLLKEWGSLNGVSYSLKEFGPRKLAGEKLKSRGYPNGALLATLEDAWGYPACDHVSWFKRNRKPAAIVTEPYGSGDSMAQLQRFLDELGLVSHQPPNPYASLWYPGYTLFVVITRPEFGEVLWLPEQLEFDGRPIHERKAESAPAT